MDAENLERWKKKIKKKKGKGKNGCTQEKARGEIGTREEKDEREE